MPKEHWRTNLQETSFNADTQAAKTSLRINIETVARGVIKVVKLRHLF